MPQDEDPKVAAQKEVKRRDVQQDLRQFLKLESGLGNSKAFVEGHKRIFGTPDEVFDPPFDCRMCAYVAETRKDLDWHLKQCPTHRFFRDAKRT